MLGKKELPGFLLSLAVAIVSYFLNLYIFRTIGAGTVAIALGIILGNLYFHQPVLEKGTGWSEKRLLELSVMLLGTSVTFQTLQDLHIRGIVFIILQMVATIAFVLILAKRLGFSAPVAKMLAAGNAVCGSSAIVAVEPVVDAEVKDRGVSITIVSLMGTLLMFLLPAISGWLFSGDNYLRGALIGGTVQSVGQVVAASAMVNSQVNTYATLFKIIRILFLFLIVIYFGATREKVAGASKKAIKKSSLMPWFVIGFLVLCVVNSFVTIPTFATSTIRFIRTWFETTALAAIGLRLNLIVFFKAGRKMMIFGLATLAFQVLLAGLLIFLLLY